MKSRRDDVARLAGVSVGQVLPATPDDVRHAYADRASSVVVEVACSGVSETGEPCYYWRVGQTYYLDDATFGDVVAIEDLDYNSQIGLHVRQR